MYVSELKKKLEGLPDDALVVVPAFDHSYREVGSAQEDQAQSINSYLLEYDEDYGLDEPHANLIKVVVIA